MTAPIPLVPPTPSSLSQTLTYKKKNISHGKPNRAKIRNRQTVWELTVSDASGPCRRAILAMGISLKTVGDNKGKLVFVHRLGKFGGQISSRFSSLHGCGFGNRQHVSFNNRAALNLLTHWTGDYLVTMQFESLPPIKF